MKVWRFTYKMPGGKLYTYAYIRANWFAHPRLRPVGPGDTGARARGAHFVLSGR